MLETPPTGPHTFRTELSQILASARLLAFAVTEVLAYTKFETVSELREERDVLRESGIAFSYVLLSFVDTKKAFFFLCWPLAYTSSCRVS